MVDRDDLPARGCVAQRRFEPGRLLGIVGVVRVQSDEEDVSDLLRPPWPRHAQAPHLLGAVVVHDVVIAQDREQLGVIEHRREGL